MLVAVRNTCTEFSSYRAARVKSLFNCDSGANFSLDAEIPVEGKTWRIGVIVGPSGSGKTSIGRLIWPDVGIYDGTAGWPGDAPIVDAIAPVGAFDDVTGALSAVGLGSVPAWLRPFHALSNGERFRAGLARLVAEGRDRVIIDEFTSVVDRQIARIGAAAFAKAWRRGAGQAILISCHYDILDWIEPDWIYDTGTGVLDSRPERRGPRFDLEVWQTDGSYWPLFEPRHYLKLPRMVAAKYYVGFVDGEAVCHIATSPKLDIGGMRACRMVVMPEWQGAGVGLRFLNAVCRMQFDPGVNKYADRVKAVYFHTSHPGLCAALRRDPAWVQVSQMLGGGAPGTVSGVARQVSAQENCPSHCYKFRCLWLRGAHARGPRLQDDTGAGAVNILLAGQKWFGAAVFAAMPPSVTVFHVCAPFGDRLDAAARGAGVPVIEAGTLNADTMPGGIDLIVAAHSHDFLGERTRLRARYGAIGYHPSLLPVHRGRDAVAWAVRMGDRVTGGSVYLLNNTVDGGPVIDQRHVFVRPGDDPKTLWRRDLGPLGVQMLCEAVAVIASAGRVQCVAQDEALSTWEPSIGRAPVFRPDLILLRGPKGAQHGERIPA